ncbi:MAG: Wzz/FepE/Etk N-terminal domain-containing protein [Chloroflexota bacterium]|nr:Wzz/FepE/Etk N-terminal domain-containing protein [Chloroflexota bacterium]
MEVGTYLRIIARYWWVILLSMLAAGGGAALLDSVRTPQYSVQARVAVRPSAVLTNTLTIVDLVGQIGSRHVTGTLAQTFTSADVKAAAREAAGLTPDEAQVYDLEANVLPDSSVIAVSASGPDPQALALYLNATISNTVSKAHQYYSVIDLEPLEMASPPVEPTSPVPARDIPLGVALGLALGVLLAIALDYLVGSRGVQSELRALHPYYNQEVNK